MIKIVPLTKASRAMNTMQTELRKPLTLRAETAADLMSPNLLSVGEQATVVEAITLLVNKGFHAAPVIDAAGKPVGVLSGTDILIHARDQRRSPAADPTRARDMMTPAVFSVGLHAPAAHAVRDLLALGVHQLFVVDAAGVLVGVISALDVARHLAAEETNSQAPTIQASLLLEE